MTDRASKRAVLIAGPTASGKSALALALAEALGGTIINADSMQVYRDLRILTARPSAQEEARVPHLLYGHVDAAENYSVGRWCVDASAALAAVELFLDVERAELYRRIDVRFDAMLASGALEEVRALGCRDLDPALPAMKAHGVPWLIRHLNGEIDLATAVDGAKRDTRRYSKRQATWFRHQLPDWTWIAPERALGEIRRALGR